MSSADKTTTKKVAGRVHTVLTPDNTVVYAVARKASIRA